MAAVNIIPLNVPPKTFEAPGKKIIVWVEPPPERHGQMILPDNSRSKLSTPIARVIAVGPGVERYDTGPDRDTPRFVVEEGDRILLYDTTPATEIRHDGQVLHAIEEVSIVGILPKKQ